MSEERVPVTLLSGFLGAGKTTLVNRILTERHGERIAVVVNEFGEVGIDGRLVVGAADEVIELANGCVCCTVRGDLSRTLGKLLAARERRLFGRKRFERVLIEASGLASPGPIAQTLSLDPRLEAGLRLDGVLTLVHAGLIARQLVDHEEAAEQIGYADRVLLNHLDRVDEAGAERAEEAVRGVNPTAGIVRSVRTEVEVGALLELGAWGTDARVESGELHSHAAKHGVGAVVLEEQRPLDLHRLKMWLRFLCTRRTHELYRMKGILRCVDHERPVVVQAIYEYLELGPGDGPAPEGSVLVLLGRDLDKDELRRGFDACLE